MAGRDAHSGRRPPGELESEVLAVLWAANAPLRPGQVQAAVGDLAYNTIHTILTRLVDKGQLLRVEHDGRPAYQPARDAAQTAADRMHQALATGADRTKVLANFVDELSTEEEAALRAALHRGRLSRRRQT